MSALIQTELAATCSSLGGMHGGKYVMEPQCYESVRDIVRFLRRDDEYHQVRRYLGESKILQTDFVHIATSSSGELFDIVIRLLVSLTNPVMLLYKEEIPSEKVGRNIYMSLIGFCQEYKVAFCDVKFWRVICDKLTALFEIDWAERSEDSSLQIERMLVLLRNVLQVPADSESERRPDNDITVHDKILWALRESQILELLLYVSSNRDEQQYYLHLLEIFSLVLREQSPGLLAKCEIRRSASEKERDTRELSGLREKEKSTQKPLKNARNFYPTFVVKNIKSFSNNEVIYHKSLDKLSDLKLTQDKRRQKTPKNKCPVDSERQERSSTFSVRLFLKEFCIEFLACGFNNLMGVVKDKLVAGRGLANDESYYFWALKFFLEFCCSCNVEVKLISECLKLETFHFTQTQIESCYDHITMDKKKISTWVKRLHLVLKAYRALLQTLMWMDQSKDHRVRESSRVLKSNLFYVVEYRELLLDCLLRYDPGKYPLSFLRDLIESNHLNLKLLEHFCKSNNIVIQRKKRIIKRSKKTETPKETEGSTEVTPENRWELIKDELFEVLSKNEDIPEITPFDAAASSPIDEQREDAMKNIQKFLWKKSLKEAVGLLRSARQVWPDGDIFGSESISVEEESMVLQEICVTDLGVVLEDEKKADVDMEKAGEEEEEDEEYEEEDEPNTEIVEQNFKIEDYVRKLVNKKVVEGCSLLLANYSKNTMVTNHCVMKLLHRIAWDCKTPSMLYQASLFVTFRKILKEKNPAYKEIQVFSKHLLKKFRENASSNPMIFMELLFWKDVKIAQDIEQGYGASDEKEKKRGWSEEEEDELRRLWVEFEERMIDADKVDWIKSNLINQDRSRLGIIKKLKELMLLPPGAKYSSKKRRGGNVWTEVEISELTELFHKFKTAVDIVTMIKERMALTRSKKSIKDKLVEIGLVGSLSELRKKRPRKGKEDMEVDDDVDDRVESSSDSESDRECEDDVKFSLRDMSDALKKVEHMKDALEWVKETFEECLEEETGSEGYPLLALVAAHTQALEDQDFNNALRKLGVVEPHDDQVYWKIKALTTMEVNERIDLINGALTGNWPEFPEDDSKTGKASESEGSDVEEDFQRLRKMMSSAVARDESKQTKNRSSRVDEKEGSSTEMEKDAFDELKDDVTSQKSESVKKVPKRRAMLASSDTESEPEQSQNDAEKRSTTVDSEVSDRGDDEDEEESRPVPAKKTRRRACLASDSEGETTPAPEPWTYKRRRCIGSDSEMEDNPSDDDRKSVPKEVRKKTKLLDSDSENEGQGSQGEADDQQF